MSSLPFVFTYINSSFASLRLNKGAYSMYQKKMVHLFLPNSRYRCVMCAALQTPNCGPHSPSFYLLISLGMSSILSSIDSPYPSIPLEQGGVLFSGNLRGDSKKAFSKLTERLEVRQKGIFFIFLLLALHICLPMIVQIFNNVTR